MMFACTATSSNIKDHRWGEPSPMRVNKLASLNLQLMLMDIIIISIYRFLLTLNSRLKDASAYLWLNQQLRLLPNYFGHLFLSV